MGVGNNVDRQRNICYAKKKYVDVRTVIVGLHIGHFTFMIEICRSSSTKIPPHNYVGAQFCK